MKTITGRKPMAETYRRSHKLSITNKHRQLGTYFSLTSRRLRLPAATYHTTIAGKPCGKGKASASQCC